MDAKLRKLAAGLEEWRGSPLEIWERAFGEERLRSLICDPPRGEASTGALPERERLEGARAESVKIVVPPGERFEWDCRVDGDGALARWVEIELGEGASASILRACAGGRFKEIWRARLAKGARFETRLAAALGAGEACEIFSWVTQEGSGASSAETARFALGDGAFGSSVARVDIERGVMEARATQLAQALHGGRGARSYLRPWMKIGADSVTASHGASSGPADAEQALYLASRGIERGVAEALLAAAFAREAFDQNDERSKAMIEFLEERR